MAETSHRKNISRNVHQCRYGKPWKMTQTRTGWHTLHTHCHPYIFLPSPHRGPTQYPHADYLSIHHHPRNHVVQLLSFTIANGISLWPTNWFHHSKTQQLHYMHKHNNSKSLFSHNCNGSVITKQQSKITKTPKQCFSQTTNCNIRATCNYPTHHNRLLLSHLFPHKKTHYVSNMLHADDAPNRQKHLPLSTSFHASINVRLMQHVHLEFHYRHHPTQAFTGLPPRRSLLPTPIGSTHHLCTKLIHVPTEHTLQYYKIIWGMAMCGKRMSSRSCLGHFSRFAIPTLMYISWNVFSVTC